MIDDRPKEEIQKLRMINNLKGAKPSKVITDLRHLVKSSADQFGDKTLYRYKDGDKFVEYPYKRLWEEMNAIGTALAERGLMGKGVALIGDVHPRWICTYLSVINGGGYSVPIDKELAMEQIVAFLDLAEVEAVVYTGAMNGKIAACADKLPRVKTFVPIHAEGETVQSDKIVPFTQLLDEGKAALSRGVTTYLDHQIDMEKMAALIFTSGTTGTSKGVMLSHKNLTAATNAACQSMCYDDRNSFVSVLPPHHSYEITCGHLAIMNLGAQILINDSLKHVMRNFKEAAPNALMLVPLYVETMHKKIWDTARKQGMEKKLRVGMKISNALLAVGIDMRKKIFAQVLDAFGGNLKSIVCGGAPLAPELIKDFYAFGVTLLEGYGITECAPLVAVNRPGKVRFHSVGTPVERCQVKIDKQPGDETGEILVKGDNVMMGYYRAPEATAAVFTEDGWFRTGDIGYMDDEGYIFITGRKKNVIILSNGKNVFPEELEEYLTPLPSIDEVVVMARENDKKELTITALVVPNEEMFVGKSKDEIYAQIKADITEVNKKLPSFKQIHAIELRDEKFERNTSRKIQRFKIK